MAHRESPPATSLQTHTIELLWFDDCPNHGDARRMVQNVVAELAPGTPIVDIDASESEVATALRFPGSPTVRIDGQDVEPDFQDPLDYTPRCRLYRTEQGIARIPAQQWVEAALLR